MARSRHVITAPAPRPPRYSLLAVAEQLSGLDLHVFGIGWQFEREQCGGQRGGIVKADCGGNTDPLEAPAASGVVGDDAFVVWAADECSTLGFQSHDFERRARTVLEASQSWWIAGELATGSIRANADDDALLDANVVTDGSETNLVDVLAKVEAAMANEGKGERGMVHMTLPTMLKLVALGALVKNGTLWETPSGHVVVADAGYEPYFNTIDGGTTIVGSSMIAVGLDAVQVPGSFLTSIDRSINLVTIYAHRSVILVSDWCMLARGDATAEATSYAGGLGGGESAGSPGVESIVTLDDGSAIADVVAYYGITVLNESADDSALVRLEYGEGTVVELVALAPGESVTRTREPWPIGTDLVMIVSGDGAADVIGSVFVTVTS